MKKLSLTNQIAIALVLAVVAGILLQGHADFVNEYIKPFGNIFLNLLKFIVVPLVLFSIMAGILSMNDVSKVGRLGLRTLLYFMFTTIIAVTLGLVTSTLMKGFLPLIHVDLSKNTTTVEVPDFSIMDQIVNMFPENIMLPLTNMTMIQVIVIAIFFGVAMVHVGEVGEPIRKLTLSSNAVVSKVLSYIMALAPYGVFCMLTPVVVSNGPSVLGSYAALIALAYFCFSVHAFCVYSSLVYLLGGLSPIRFFKELQPAMLFAFSSDSSVATLPYTMKCTEKMGVRKDIGNFVLSLGATINMDGPRCGVGLYGDLLWHRPDAPSVFFHRFCLNHRFHWYTRHSRRFAGIDGDGVCVGADSCGMCGDCGGCRSHCGYGSHGHVDYGRCFLRRCHAEQVKEAGIKIFISECSTRQEYDKWCRRGRKSGRRCA